MWLLAHSKISQSMILYEDGGITIWYLWDCHGQEEVKMLTLCNKYLAKEAANDIFVLTYERMRRFEGAWHTEVKMLFPSYIFLDSGDEALLEAELGRISFEKYGIVRMTRDLRRIDWDVENFLKCLYGNRRHLKMSKGVIQDGIPKITAGPLRGMEQSISKIDRHRRLARLTVPLGQRADGYKRQDVCRREFGYITAGLEITSCSRKTDMDGKECSRKTEYEGNKRLLK